MGKTNTYFRAFQQLGYPTYCTEETNAGHGFKRHLKSDYTKVFRKFFQLHAYIFNGISYCCQLLLIFHFWILIVILAAKFCILISRKLIPVHWKNFLQTHGTAMGTKMAVAFANIFMGKVESQILERNAKTCTSRLKKVRNSIEQANSHHPTIKFTAEVSDTEPRHKSLLRISLWESNKNFCIVCVAEISITMLERFSS